MPQSSLAAAQIDIRAFVHLNFPALVGRDAMP